MFDFPERIGPVECVNIEDEERPIAIRSAAKPSSHRRFL
jgi:hypothetical protein